MTFIDLCSGIGGFRYGFEQAGHKCIGYAEKDKYAVQAYRAMYNTDKEWYFEDIRQLTPEIIPYADIWTFGFPCQDVSISGNRKGLHGERSGLYFKIIDLIKGKSYQDRPKLIIAENVNNLLSINNGWDFVSVLYEMDAAGYNAEWQIYNSKDFGVPQSRKRIFIVGFLRGYAGGKVLPEPRESLAHIKQLVGGPQSKRIYDTSGTSITLSSEAGGKGGRTGLYFIDLSLNKPQITDISRCIQARYNKGITNRKGEVSGVIETYPCITPDKIEIRQNGRRVKNCNEPMFTLTAQDRHGIIIYSIKNNLAAIRKLTPKECWRLQGFPDELFEKAKQTGLSDNQLYRQAGNAVTTNITYEIGKSIKNLYW